MMSHTPLEVCIEQAVKPLMTLTESEWQALWDGNDTDLSLMWDANQQRWCIKGHLQRKGDNRLIANECYSFAELQSWLEENEGRWFGRERKKEKQLRHVLICLQIAMLFYPETQPEGFNPLLERMGLKTLPSFNEGKAWLGQFQQLVGDDNQTNDPQSFPQKFNLILSYGYYKAELRQWGSQRPYWYQPWKRYENAVDLQAGTIEGRPAKEVWKDFNEYESKSWWWRLTHRQSRLYQLYSYYYVKKSLIVTEQEGMPAEPQKAISGWRHAVQLMMHFTQPASNSFLHAIKQFQSKQQKKVDAAKASTKPEHFALKDYQAQLEKGYQHFVAKNSARQRMARMITDEQQAELKGLEDALEKMKQSAADQQAAFQKAFEEKYPTYIEQMLKGNTDSQSLRSFIKTEFQRMQNTFELSRSPLTSPLLMQQKKAIQQTLKKEEQTYLARLLPANEEKAVVNFIEKSNRTLAEFDKECSWRVDYPRISQYEASRYQTLKNKMTALETAVSGSRFSNLLGRQPTLSEGAKYCMQVQRYRVTLREMYQNLWLRNWEALQKTWLKQGNGKAEIEEHAIFTFSPATEAFNRFVEKEKVPAEYQALWRKEFEATQQQIQETLTTRQQQWRNFEERYKEAFLEIYREQTTSDPRNRFEGAWGVFKQNYQRAIFPAWLKMVLQQEQNKTPFQITSSATTMKADQIIIERKAELEKDIWKKNLTVMSAEFHVAYWDYYRQLFNLAKEGVALSDEEMTKLSTVHAGLLRKIRSFIHPDKMRDYPLEFQEYGKKIWEDTEFPQNLIQNMLGKIKASLRESEEMETDYQLLRRYYLAKPRDFDVEKKTVTDCLEVGKKYLKDKQNSQQDCQASIEKYNQYEKKINEIREETAKMRERIAQQDKELAQRDKELAQLRQKKEEIEAAREATNKDKKQFLKELEETARKEFPEEYAAYKKMKGLTLEEGIDYLLKTLRAKFRQHTEESQSEPSNTMGATL